MQPTWIIETNVEGLPSEALQAVIRGHGMSAHLVKPFLHAKPPSDILGAESVSLDGCVVFTGTLTLMRYIQRHRRWTPGGWCNFENLACSIYYAHFGEHLLNRNYALLPAAEAIRQQDRIFSLLSRGGQVFIRPDSVDKLFAGKLVDARSYEEILAPSLSTPTTMVLVAEPQEIGCEWRLFVAHSRVATGSQYRVNGRTKPAPGVPAEVENFAKRVLEDVRWRPDPLFVLDVCESRNGLRIVELNSFSCSGQCACDLDAYVNVASKFASLQW
ncbi:MAG: ATP-grasp domain-containing protein [Pirellulaceae bacterium]